jgi:RNA polymerase sigma-70 factor, ECF subfamily
VTAHSGDRTVPERSDSTSPTLLDRVQANQAGAWERLVDLYTPLVYHWCRRWGLGPDDAADVFQEVFRSVAQHIESFRRDRPGSTFRGWLRTITHNKVRDHFRRQAGEPRAAGGSDAQMVMLDVPDQEAEEDPAEAGVVVRQLRRTLEEIRGEFEERTWTAFWQVQMEGRDTAEVGAELGLTASAVRKAKFRVLRRLREELGDLLD